MANDGHSTTRRQFLAAAPAVAAAVVLPSAAVLAASAGTPRLTQLIAQWKALRENYNGSDDSEEADDRYNAEIVVLEEAIIITEPANARDAIAAIEAIREDYFAFQIQSCESACIGDRFWLSGFDKALTALRASLAGGSNG